MWANSLGQGGILQLFSQFFPGQFFMDLKLTGSLEKIMSESVHVAQTLSWKLTSNERKEWINNNFIYHIMKQYKDFNVNNYIICYIYVEFDNKPFDEKLYNEYHEEYLKYYSKNPNIKLIVWTNNFDWCKLNFKFFNTTYIYFKTYEKILK